MSKFYEIVFIVRPDATSTLVESIAGEVTGIINDGGGCVTKTEFCGLRQFAYPIKKNKKGHYVLLNISADGAVVAEIARKLRINENVLRHLIVYVDSLDNNPSALMQNRHYRENVFTGDESEESIFDLEESNA
jgi:small subunit ribosomal protein S6